MRPLLSRGDGRSDQQDLHAGWELAGTPSGAFPTLEALRAGALPWQPAVVPGTVAQSLDADLEQTNAFDAQDWWYRCAFDAAPGGLPQILHFEGLATLADVWLNGELILQSRNMFRAYACDVTTLLRPQNELVICFRALAPELAQRKPRPRWKTALVNAQNLRWIRTTLLGRMPSWTPATPPVGPWKAIRLEARLAEMRDLSVHATAPEGTAHLAFRAALELPASITRATLHVGSQSLSLPLRREGSVVHLNFEGHLPDQPLWWPHTHGTPALVPCRLALETTEGPLHVDLGRVGFRTITVDRREGRVQFAVNGRPLFCRGACWTVADFRSLVGTTEQLHDALRLAHAMHANMLRVGGTMTYESDAFYARCDELGILVWQDFMFANMDYPFDDEAFRAEVIAEVRGQLQRLHSHPCVAVHCGGSEILQQAAMLGFPASEWCHPFLAETLPQLCAELQPGLPYFPSSPCEGPLPFHTREGITHYYGVGAYRRPLEDARRAEVKFAAECLGFSNVPEEENMHLLADGTLPVPHHPRWKAGVPRDNGAGWDFEDIRDHYLRELFHVDPVSLRSTDLERYYALSRVVTGEVMLRTYAEWRRPGSGCGGALVWFFKDLRPGAGWGLLDSDGRPKAAYWYLKRAWAPRAVLLTDEGLDGLHLHILNEHPEPLDATVELELLQDARTRVGFASVPVSVPPFSATTLSGDAMLGSFTDLSYAYRFGAPRHDVVIARLLSAAGSAIHSDVHFPLGHHLAIQASHSLQAEAHPQAGGSVGLTCASQTFVHSLRIQAKGYEPDANYLSIAPGSACELTQKPLNGTPVAFKAHLEALNLKETITVRPQ